MFGLTEEHMHRLVIHFRNAEQISSEQHKQERFQRGKQVESSPTAAKSPTFEKYVHRPFGATEPDEIQSSA